MINNYRAAKDPIEKLKSDSSSYFISPFDLDIRLKELAKHLAIKNIGLRVTVTDVDHDWGTCEGDPTSTYTLEGPGVKLALYVSSSAEALDLNVQQQLHLLFKALIDVWGRGYRKHGALNYQASDAEEMLHHSLLPMANIHGIEKFSIVYIDLDNFKNLNDQSNHAEGDKAIRAVYKEMHVLCRKLGGLAFIAGGDEFLLVLPCENAMSISSSLWELRGQVQRLSFAGKKKLRIGMTAGVVTRTLDEVSMGLSAIKDECEELTKTGEIKKEKRRGTVTFEHKSEDNLDSYPADLGAYFRLGICISKSRQQVENCFADERLNLVYQQIQKSPTFPPAPKEISQAVQDVIKWFGASLDYMCDELSLIKGSGSVTTISQCAIAIAIVHALSKSAALNKWPEVNEHTIIIKWSRVKKTCLVLFNQVPIWGDFKTVMTDEINFGKLVNTSSTGESEGVVVGVQVGFDEIPRTATGRTLPDGFLIDHVRVDVRPRTGGGLPDFWQAALAQVVSALYKADKSTKILVWGEKVEETEIFKRLTNTKSWTNDEIASLTGLTTDQVRKIVSKIKERIIVVKSSDDLLINLYDTFKDFSGSSTSGYSRPKNEKYPLERPMIITDPLDQSEGIVCTTARKAYPLIVDTLRKTPTIRLAIDDSGQEQRELIAFKLKLTHPTEDEIPDYLKSQIKFLNDYAENVLLSETGVIRATLEKDRQVSAFCSHLSKYVAKGQIRRSTRRACLIVPHTPDENGGPKPLGLISVWATPRFKDGLVYLDFVYVWRTVEAFIGLPYSLYGSIRLAEQLTKTIIDDSGSKNIQIGELTYIALSLHIGSDEFHTRVAKQIVDMASD